VEGCSAKYLATFVNVQYHRESGLLCCSLVKRKFHASGWDLGTSIEG